MIMGINCKEIWMLLVVEKKDRSHQASSYVKETEMPAHPASTIQASFGY
jgi:hypothetical protein